MKITAVETFAVRTDLVHPWLFCAVRTDDGMTGWLNIAPHNFNSHLATAISLNLRAAVSNVKILEHDVDSIPWRDAFTTFAPRIENGMMEIPTGPGWGCDVVEEALVEYRADLEDWGPWKL